MGLDIDSYEKIEIEWKDILPGDIIPEDGENLDNGKFSIVEFLSNWEDKKCYELTDECNNSIVVSEDHLINCQFYFKLQEVETIALYEEEALKQWSTAQHMSQAFSEGYAIKLLPNNTWIKDISLYHDGEPQKVRCITTNNGHYFINGFNNHNTTLLSYMASYRLDEKDNLCTIEDTKELNIDVPLAEITNAHSNIHSLFVNTLRQYPSHVIIGETRTDEIVDILENALTINVGTTIHADSFQKAIQRIVFMSLKRKIPADDILSLINASIDCFILMRKRKIEGMWIHKDEFEKDIYKAYKKI